MKVMVLGDTHGNTIEALRAVKSAAALNLPVIMQCGDFGLWPGKGGMDYLDLLNAELLTQDIVLVWVDGNHEDFDQLDRLVAHNPKNQWGQTFIRSNILYSPRGCKWKMEGKMWMTVGGAVSIDKAYRKQGVSWWPQEQLTDEQLDKIVAHHEASPGPVDYLFTHDCPTNAPFRGRWKNDMESLIHRERMDKLGKTIKPKLWFHGHMHTRFDGYEFPAYEPTTKVYGLECDGMYDNWGVLDTETDEFTWGEKEEATLTYKFLDEEQGEWVEWTDKDWVGDNF